MLNVCEEKSHVEQKLTSDFPLANRLILVMVNCVLSSTSSKSFWRLRLGICLSRCACARDKRAPKCLSRCLGASCVLQLQPRGQHQPGHLFMLVGLCLQRLWLRLGFLQLLLCQDAMKLHQRRLHVPLPLDLAHRSPQRSELHA